MQTMIETKDLTFAYPAEEGEEPRAALKDVNVSISSGAASWWCWGTTAPASPRWQSI